MNRRSFCTLTAGALVSKQLLNAQMPPATTASPLHFTQEITGAGPYSRSHSKKPPNIFLISIDMVSPDLYHPDRPLSRHVEIPAIRSLMNDYLVTLGYEVTIAVDGQDALKKFIPGVFDCVISDLMMPKISGLELLKEMRIQDKKIFSS